MVNKKIQYLDELLRIAANEINYSPNYTNEIKTLSNKNYKDNQYKTYPKCYIKLKYKNGTDEPFFPLCNTLGVIDPKIISFSLKLSKRIKEKNNDSKIDFDELENVIKRLESLLKRFSKEQPVSFEMAAKKGNITKRINFIKKYTDELNKAGN